MDNKYLKIINLPHHESKTHKRMNRLNRAAQFAPFAALTGFDQAIIETARLTHIEQEHMEDKKEIINNKLEILNRYKNPKIKVIYFENDKNKVGGSYLIKEGTIKKIDQENHKIIFVDQSFIYFDKLFDIESDIFDDFSI